MATERITQAFIRPGSNYVYLAWIVKDERGAVHFHFDASAEPSEISRQLGDDGWARGGVETHYASPPDYMKDDKPSHDHCEILGAPCWHDGTSLWASEHWMPNVRRFGTEWVWRELEWLHKRTFYPEDHAP